VSVHISRHVDDVLENLSSRRDATILAGGTDLLVEINFGRQRPAHVVAIDRVDELRDHSRNGHVRMGALFTYTRMLETDVGSLALQEAARTIGSPQIRNAATIGGNLGTCSPAGDTLTVLAALEATVVLKSKKGERRVTFADFMTGPKKSVRRPDELIVAAEWNDAGPAQTFMKVGTRNAMVIAVAGLALVVDRRVGASVRASARAGRRSSARPTPSASPQVCSKRPAGSCRIGRATRRRRSSAGLWPAPRSRSTTCVARAAYRRHVLAVMGARALMRVAAIA